MECPQCGAQVPDADAFCGRCGYAMRDQDPQRTDRSRIRFHEERAVALPQPEPEAPAAGRARKPTVIGMPAAERRGESDEPNAASPTTAVNPNQQTMLGMPRIEPQTDAGAGSLSADASDDDRGRAFVRYDSLLEPPSVVIRRKRALRGVAVLVLLATAWLVYRFLDA